MRETRRGGGDGGGKHAQTLVLHPMNLVKNGDKLSDKAQYCCYCCKLPEDDGRGMYNVVKIFVVAPALLGLFPCLFTFTEPFFCQVAKLSHVRVVCLPLVIWRSLKSILDSLVRFKMLWCGSQVC